MKICEYGCGQQAKYNFSNGKQCCSKHYASCPASRKNRFTVNANNVFVKCTFCDRKIGKTNIKRHENFCYLNSKNTKFCPVCGKPIKNWKENITCSTSCANTLLRSGVNNPNWKGNNYRAICFTYHGKKCLICKEELIVATHHMDSNKDNNHPTNLVPLCPTHHMYWHSRYRYLIEDKILAYIVEFTIDFGETRFERA